MQKKILMLKEKRKEGTLKKSSNEETCKKSNFNEVK